MGHIANALVALSAHSDPGRENDPARPLLASAGTMIRTGQIMPVFAPTARSLKSPEIAARIAITGCRPPFRDCLVEWDGASFTPPPSGVKYSGALCHVEGAFLRLWFLFLSSDGYVVAARYLPQLEVIGDYDGWKLSRCSSPPGVLSDEFRQLSHADQYREAHIAARAAFPALAVFSLLECANVSLIDVHPPEAVQKKRLRKNKPPLVTYKTICIDPMGVKTRRSAQEHHDYFAPQSMPLHIVRGHQKDYTEGRGLFGRIKGRFWWSQHAQGAEENGVVIKDYVVETSGPEPEDKVH